MFFHSSSTTAELGIYCKKCGYDLRGCLENRCSECGRKYDKTDPHTFRCYPPRVRLRKWIKRGLLFLMLIVIPPIAVWGWLWWGLLAEIRLIENTTNLKANPWPIGGAWGIRVYTQIEDLAFVLCRTDAVDFTEDATDQDVSTNAGPIQQFKWLVSMSLSRTKITDAGLAKLPELKELQFLYLDNMQISDAGLVNLQKFIRLKTLALGKTKVTDAGLARLSVIKDLQLLFLDGTNVTDAGLIHLKDLKKLRSIYLRGTKVTPEGVKKLQAALPNTNIVFENITTNPQ